MSTPPTLDLAAMAARLAGWLPGARWFGGKGRPIAAASLVDYAWLDLAEPRLLLALVEVRYADGPAERYFLPLVARRDEPADPPGELALNGESRTLQDALASVESVVALLLAIEQGLTVPTSSGGSIKFTAGPALAELRPADPRANVRPLGVEQSNSSVVFDNALILKVFRRVYDGPNPDLEVPRFLSTRTGFDYLPRWAGAIEYFDTQGTTASLGILQEFARSEGDGWTVTLRALASGQGDAPAFQEQLANLARVTADLHLALASDLADPSFAPEAVEPADLEAWQEGLRGWVRSSLDALAACPAEQIGPLGRRVLAARAQLEARAERLGSLQAGAFRKIRYHGDFHLGQVLRAGQGWLVLDFEGEPLRPLAERRARGSPLKDVAGMLRSFDYAAQVAARENPSLDPARQDEWAQATRTAFLEAYLTRATGAVFLPSSPDEVASLLAAFELEKASYELRYELNNRPDWLPIPLAALARLASQA